MNWLTTEQALAALGTKPQTLYANVSRGRIKARPDPADSRRSLYLREDIERLAEHHRGRRKATDVAAQTISWGDPVLTTAISTIADGRLYYRGRDALTLAKTESLEGVAALLWQAPLSAFPSHKNDKHGDGVESAFLTLGRLAASDLPSLGRNAGILKKEAARVVGALANALTGATHAADPIHQRLATHWSQPAAADIIRRLLVVLAEHELNASTFATRVAASTGAALSAAVLSGLATLSGPLHGGASAAMRELADSALRNGAEQTIRFYLAQGRTLPCFGHRLYPDGDIRAKAVLDHIDLPAPYGALADAALEITGEKPNIDFALAAVTAAHSLPSDASFVIFTLARSVGWLAHALEQIENGRLIRPRAQYAGPALEPAIFVQNND